MTATIHKVVENMHTKVIHTQNEIEKKYKVKMEMGKLLTMADGLRKKAVPTNQEQQVIRDAMKEAMSELTALINKVKGMKNTDIKGIQHSLKPLHDYIEGVHHTTTRQIVTDAEHEVLLKQKRDAVKAQAMATSLHPAKKQSALFPPKPKESVLTLKDEKAKKIAQTYEELTANPHTRALLGATIEHSEQKDSDIISKLSHAKQGLSNIGDAHEREALAKIHNRKVEQLTALYTSVAAKCSKGSNDDKAKASYYTSCVHKLGQTRVEADKMHTHQKHK